MDDERPHLEGLVPPRRLGLLLLGLRQARGDSLDDASARTAGALSADRLLALETGESTPTDSELDALARAYAFELTDLVPQRVELVLDYDERLIDAGGGFAAVVPEGTTLEEVLQRYLILVWALRGRQPGSYLQLRELDLHVLGEGLAVGTSGVVGMLAELLDQQDWVAPYRHPSQYGRPRFATVVPEAGIMLCGGHGGALVFRPDRSAPPLSATPTASVVQEPIEPYIDATPEPTFAPEALAPEALAPEAAVPEPMASEYAEPAIEPAEPPRGSWTYDDAAFHGSAQPSYDTPSEPAYGSAWGAQEAAPETPWGTTAEPTYGATTGESTWGTTESTYGTTAEPAYGSVWDTQQPTPGISPAGSGYDSASSYQPLYGEPSQGGWLNEPEPIQPEPTQPVAYQPLFPEAPASEPEPAPTRGLGLPTLGTSAGDADPFADLRRAFTADYDTPPAEPEPAPAPAPAPEPARGADLASWFDRAATTARIVDDEPSSAATFLSSLAPQMETPAPAPAEFGASSGLDDYGMELRWGAALDEPAPAPAPSRALPDWRSDAGLVNEPLAVAEQLSSSNPFAHLYASDDQAQPEPTRPQPLVPKGLPYAVPEDDAALPSAAPAPWDPQGAPRLLRKLFPGKA